MYYEFMPEGTTVFKAGELGTTFYIILKGSASVVIAEEDPNNSNNKVWRDVRTLFEGESFGELALISNKPRSATIVTQTDCHFAVLDKKFYRQVLSNH